MKLKELKIKEKTVVHCQTEELASKVLSLVDRLGYKWYDGDSFLDKSEYHVHKKSTCYNFFSGLYGSLDYYLSDGFNIISAEDFINLHKINTKKQIGGDHYSSKTIQPIDYIQANDLSFCEGNVVKYVTRHKGKNGKEDIMKAIQYLQFILNYEYKTETELVEL